MSHTCIDCASGMNILEFCIEAAMLKEHTESPGIRTFVAYTLLISLCGILISSGCKSERDRSTPSPPEPVYFSKNWRAETGFPNHDRCWMCRAESGGLEAFLATDEGFLQSSSFDNGRSWTSPRMIFAHGRTVVPIFWMGQLRGVATLEKVPNGGQIYFHSRSGEEWSEPHPIRDTNWGDFSMSSFASDSLGNIYYAWTDWRDGNPDVYFSSSLDGGKTWNANVRIDDDQSGQDQTTVGLISTPEGVLCALWDDNRNPKTLFDIYCSSSHDGGKTWSPGVKVNDDTTHTWQRDAFPALDAQAYIYVAWTDYRDKGASGDITPNIYFARSEDDGKSWSQNVRISYARYGGDLYPRLSLVSDGTLNCTWMNSEDNLLFDIFFSNSHDGGRTWSQPTRVNDDPERVQHVHRPIGWLGPDLKGNIVVGWLDWREGQPAVYMAQLLDHPDTARPERKPQRTVAASEVKPAFVMESGEMLFQDDFADGPSPQWEVQSGIWVSKDQTYIGYGAYEARSFVGSESWNDYVFQGRFKLDPIEHLAAYLYFRAMINDERYPRYYRITNFFRRGVTLEYFDGKSLLPLVDAAYPFQKDRWYTFRTVVKGNVLNHFIDDSLLIVTNKLTYCPRGRVGVGVFFSPTCFKDIVVRAVK